MPLIDRGHIFPDEIGANIVPHGPTAPFVQADIMPHPLPGNGNGGTVWIPEENPNEGGPRVRIVNFAPVGSPTPPPTAPPPNNSPACTADPVTCALLAELQGAGNFGGAAGGGFGPTDAASVVSGDPMGTASSGSPWAGVIIVGVIGVIVYFLWKHYHKKGPEGNHGE